MMTQTLKPWGMVLAGGKSTRLGQDKVVTHVEGRPLLQRTLELASEHCQEVVISGRNPSSLQDVPAPLRATAWFPDVITGCGPMGGIITCLEQLRQPILALACDLPMLDHATLEQLIEMWRQRPIVAPDAVMTTFLQPETGYIESLVAIYEPAAAPLLRQAVESGCYKLSNAVPYNRRCHIPYSPEEAHVFFNINYPADLAVLMRMQGVEARVAMPS